MKSHFRRMVQIWKLLISFTLLLLELIRSSPECNFPAIFNFGDSNSDTGGLSAMFGEVPPPNGKTFFHSPAGRDCDGRVLIDFIAEGLELPLLSSHLDSMGTNFSQEPILPQSDPQSGVKTPPFSKAGEVFKNLFPEKNKFSSALYSFDIGQNDLTAGYQLNMSTEQVKAYVPDVISQFSTVIKNVYDRGGRTFWIHNTGPVGCLPYIMDQYLITAAQANKYGCAAPYNDVAQYFNRKLKEAVIELQKELSLATIIYVDIYSVKYSLIGQARELRFDDPFLTCCGYGGKYNFNSSMRCGSTIMVEGKEILIAKSCDDPSSRVIWDGIHFTEAANRWIYGQIATGAFSDPPVPLNMVCHRGELETVCTRKSHGQTMKSNLAESKNHMQFGSGSGSKGFDTL